MKAIERIKVELEKKHISASKFSKAMGLSQSTFSSWSVRNSDPPLDMIEKMADYLGVTIEYLVTGKDCPYTVQLLSDPERNLLGIYNSMSENSQKMLLQYANDLLDSSTNLKLTT